MSNTILTWEGADHQAIYLRQLKENPLFYDTHLKIWVAYSYMHCKAIFGTCRCAHTRMAR